MVQVDELGIVLEAYTRGLEEGLEKATQKTKEFEKSTGDASLKTMESLAVQEAMVSSLNQISGGFAKATAAASELGFINEEQTKSLNKARFAFELVAGPVEVAIALQKLYSITSLATIKAKIMESAVVTKTTAAYAKLNAVMAANPIMAIVIGVILLVVALVALERKFGLVTKSVEMLGQIFEILSNKVDKVLDSIKGVTSAAAELGDALAFGPISGVMNVLGGR